MPISNLGKLVRDGSGALSIDSILTNLQMAQNEANAATQKRLEEALGIYDKIISQYEPGGAFGAGVEAQIERGATKSVAQGTQDLVSSGLYGITQTAGLRKKYEEEVGQPARLILEDLRLERLAQAQQAKAGVLERVEDVGPDLGMIAQLMQQVGMGQGGGVTTDLNIRGLSKFAPFHEVASKIPTVPKTTASPSVVYGSDKAKEFWAKGLTTGTLQRY